MRLYRTLLQQKLKNIHSTKLNTEKRSYNRLYDQFSVNFKELV